MIKRIALIVVAALIAVLAYVALQPPSFRLEREASIQAPPETIFALISDFHRWSVWSPWEETDPNLKRTYSGPDSGQGAVYAWEGNEEMGEGRMEIIEATSPSRVVIKLDILEPFEGHNTAEFTLRPEGNSTRVNWAMYGRNTFMGKLMSVFIDIDSMVGKQFEAGLAALKRAAEG